jgi:apolipoprotein N-acyltransferase
VGAASALAMTLAVVKIATAPIPLAMTVVFGVPLGLISAAGLVAFAWVRRVLDAEGTSNGIPVLFAVFMVLAEWLQHTCTEFGAWGVAAHTQTGDLALMQLASVTGLAGVSFVVYLVNAALEHTLHLQRQGRPSGRLLVFAVTTWLAVQAFGSARLFLFESATDTVRVAAVGTDATFGGLPLPSARQRADIDATLERRVRSVAAQGAEIVVWNEGATLVLEEDRRAALTRWSSLARELEVVLVTAWITPVDLDPLLYENVSYTFLPDGSHTEPYLKHHPVPGEPAIAGPSPATSLEVGDTRLSTAICYDADFPRLGLVHAQRGVSLLALPSSDWRGIDPIHTEMAAFRAVEGGYSVLRSTRLGLSAGIDTTGRMRASRSWFDEGDRTMIVDLPRHRTWTPYSALGDWFILLCALIALAASASALSNAQRDASPAA